LNQDILNLIQIESTPKYEKDIEYYILSGQYSGEAIIAKVWVRGYFHVNFLFLNCISDLEYIDEMTYNLLVS
jgi:hypothetical protein